MHSFFAGWKRKLGIMALVIACVFTSVWTRKSPLNYRLQIEAFETDIRIVVQAGAYLAVNTVTTIGQGGLKQDVLGGPKAWHNWIVLPIPYWSLVAFFAFLSAWLLISKPASTARARSNSDGEST